MPLAIYFYHHIRPSEFCAYLAISFEEQLRAIKIMVGRLVTRQTKTKL